MQVLDLRIDQRSVDTAPFSTLSSMLGGIREKVHSGMRPPYFPMSDGPVGSLELRPGEVFVMAGAPNTGKTALAMQWAVDAIRNTPGIRLLVANVEMSQEVLIRRQLARLSGTFLGRILNNESCLRDDQNVARAFATLESLEDRIAFMNHPFSMDQIARAVDEYRPQIVLIDYVQRIETHHVQADTRQRLNAVMHGMRQLASSDACVVAVSAVARTSSKRDGGYDGRSMGLGSFRESSEVEYGADEAIILVPDDDGGGPAGGSYGSEPGDWPRLVLLRHVKSRNNERRDVPLYFDGRVQRFWVRAQAAFGGGAAPRFYGPDDYPDRSQDGPVDYLGDVLHGNSEDEGEVGNE